MLDAPILSDDQIVAACRECGIDGIDSVRRRTGGALSDVYEVRGAEDVRLIVKVYAQQWAWKQRKEAYIYGLLRPTAAGLTPEIIDVRDASNSRGFAYTIMTCRPGRPLSEVSTRLDSATLHSLYRSIGQLARAVHSIGQDAFGYLVTRIVEPHPDNAAYMTAQFDKRLVEFVAAGDPDQLSIGIKRRLDRDAYSLAECPHASLCHNDLYEGNVLVDDASGCWELTGLIDVENAIAADPLLDLAKIDCYSIRGNYSKAAGLAAGYDLDLDAARARFDLYRIYHTLELWDWFHQIGQIDPLPGLARQLAALLDRD